MTAQELFYYSASVAIWIIILAAIVTAYFIVTVLKSINETVQDVKETAHNVQRWQAKVRVGVLSFLVNMLGGSKRR
ncbi:MAG: hypothetical protein ACOX6V_01770 [Patescibacteria group bacterium]|jgi:hypothetical protein